MRSAGLFERWATWRWRFPVELSVAFLVGLVVTMSVARGLRDAAPPARAPFLWDDYIAAVAAIYVAEPNRDLDGARRRLAAIPSDAVNLAVAAAATNPPGSGTAREWNRRNLEELNAALASATTAAPIRATPLPPPPPVAAAEPESPFAGLLTALAVAGIVTVVVGLGYAGFRAFGPGAGRRSERPTRRRAEREAATTIAPAPPSGPTARQRPLPPALPPDRGADGRYRPPPPTPDGPPLAPLPPARPGSVEPVVGSRRSTAVGAPAGELAAVAPIVARSRYTFGEAEFEELVAFTEPVTGHLIGGGGVSSGMALPDTGDVEAYVAFIVWVHDIQRGTKVRSLGIVSRWAATERRSEVEEWAVGMGLEAIEVARAGRIRGFELEGMVVEIVLEEVDYAADPQQPRQSYFAALTVRFDVTPRAIPG